VEGGVSREAAVLLLPPRDDGRRTLLALHPTVVPGALASLVDLGPRPGGEDGREPCVPDAVADVTRRWQLVAQWRLPDETPGNDGLEVIDSASGLWLVTGAPVAEPPDPASSTPVAAAPLAWPVTPTLVWRQIVRVVMRRASAAR
jgi:hypothetical protein